VHKEGKTFGPDGLSRRKGYPGDKKDCRFDDLEEISPFIYPLDILGTHKGIQALAEFLIQCIHLVRNRPTQHKPIQHKPTIDDRLPDNHFNEGLEDGHPTATQLDKHFLYFLFHLSPRHSHNIIFKHTTILLFH